jgi:uncharacterized membrane protein
MKHETVARSLVKTIVFRLVVTVVTGLILFGMGRNVAEAMQDAILVNLALTVFYYINERIWANIDWGFK